MGKENRDHHQEISQVNWRRAIVATIQSGSKIPYSHQVYHQETSSVSCTAKSQKSDKRDSMDIVANNYFTRPFVGSELLKAVEMRLKRREVSKAAIIEEVSVAESLQEEASTHIGIGTCYGVLDAFTMLAAMYGNYTKYEALGFVGSIYSSDSILKSQVRQGMLGSDLKQISQDGGMLKERRQDQFIEGIADGSVSWPLFFNSTLQD